MQRPVMLLPAPPDLGTSRERREMRANKAIVIMTKICNLSPERGCACSVNHSGLMSTHV